MWCSLYLQREQTDCGEDGKCMVGWRLTLIKRSLLFVCNISSGCSMEDVFQLTWTPDLRRSAGSSQLNVLKHGWSAQIRSDLLHGQHQVRMFNGKCFLMHYWGSFSSSNFVASPWNLLTINLYCSRGIKFISLI